MTSAEYRKIQTINVIKRDIDCCMGLATNNEKFDTLWKIPEYIVEKKAYFLLAPIIDYYKSQGYYVEFEYDEVECQYIYFSWF